MSNATSNAGPGNGNGNPERKALTKVDQLKSFFEQWRPTLKAMLPRHIDPERVIKIAMNVYFNKPELQSCTPISMVKATLQCAEYGLDPSPFFGECAFIPFENKKKVRDGNTWKDVKVLEVQLMPMFVGLIKLAKQNGDVSDVYAVVVDESEKTPEFDDRGNVIAGFYVEQGTVRKIHHVQRLEGRTGNLYAVYGVVLFRDGTHHFEVLSRSDVDRIRARSKSKDTGPWATDYDEMAKKTAIKRAVKTVPKSAEKPQLAKALAHDNAIDLGEAFSSEYGDAIDVEGAPVEETPPPAKPATRTDELAHRLGSIMGSPPHDPVTGEVK
jgi:recombination protein RecT